MSQHDYIIANAVAATVRSDINDMAAAIATLNAGASEPATMYAYMLWADTTTGLLKQRNAANTDWIVKGLLADIVTRSTSFTPTLYDASTGGNAASISLTKATYAISAGRCHGTIELTNITTAGMTAGNQLFIRDMPVVAGGATNAQHLCPVGKSAVTTTTGHAHGRIVQGNSYISLFDDTLTGAAILTVAAIASGTGDILVHFDYPI